MYKLVPANRPLVRTEGLIPEQQQYGQFEGASLTPEINIITRENEIVDLNSIGLNVKVSFPSSIALEINNLIKMQTSAEGEFAAKIARTAAYQMGNENGVSIELSEKIIERMTNDFFVSQELAWSFLLAAIKEFQIAEGLVGNGLDFRNETGVDLEILPSPAYQFIADESAVGTQLYQQRNPTGRYEDANNTLTPLEGLTRIYHLRDIHEVRKHQLNVLNALFLNLDQMESAGDLTTVAALPEALKRSKIAICEKLKTTIETKCSALDLVNVARSETEDLAKNLRSWAEDTLKYLIAGDLKKMSSIDNSTIKTIRELHEQNFLLDSFFIPNDGKAIQSRGFLFLGKKPLIQELQRFIESLSCIDHGDGRPEKIGLGFEKLGKAITAKRLSQVGEIINKMQ